MVLHSEGRASRSLTAEGVLWSLTLEGVGNMKRGPNVAVVAKNLAVVVGTTPLRLYLVVPSSSG